MNRSIAGDIEAWEGDGGRALPPLAVVAVTMMGAANQVEWAERIRRQVTVDGLGTLSRRNHCWNATSIFCAISF
jgi:hypothetical protein